MSLRVSFSDILKRSKYYVKEYGLVGDGTTNDATLLNALLSTISTNNAEIIFSIGTYKLASNVTIPDNVKVTIDKGAILKRTDSAVIALNCEISAGLYQIFDDDSTGSLTIDSKNSNPPHWYYTNSWLTAFTKAFSANLTVHAPEGTYDFGGGTLSLASYSSLIGVKPKWNGTTFINGTIINAGKISISSANKILIDSVGIINTNAEGIIVSGNSSYINIFNSKFKVLKEGVLCHSLSLDCNNITVKDCSAYGCNVGYAIKAKYVKLIRCDAYNSNYEAIIISSDNILGAGLTSTAQYIDVIDCNCIDGIQNGISIYGRDHFSESNANNVVQCSDINIVGGNIVGNGNYSIMVGDDSHSTGRTELIPKNVNIKSVKIKSTQAVPLIAINRVRECIIDSCSFTSPVNPIQNRRYTNASTGITDVRGIHITNNSSNNQPMNMISLKSQLNELNTSTVVAWHGDIYKTANTQATSITEITPNMGGQIITINILDDYTTIIKGTYMRLKSNISGNGSIITLKRDDTNSYWDEMSRCEVDSSIKVKFTPEGGLAIKLTNKTGAASVKGSLVSAGTVVDNSFILQTNEFDTIGAVYENGVADGSDCWVVVSGIAQVLLADNTASTRGNWVIAHSTDGRADATQPTPSPNNTTNEHTTHFKEIGHCLESYGGGINALIKVVLHFN